MPVARCSGGNRAKTGASGLLLDYYSQEPWRTLRCIKRHARGGHSRSHSKTRHLGKGARRSSAGVAEAAGVAQTHGHYEG